LVKVLIIGTFTAIPIIGTFTEFSISTDTGTETKIPTTASPSPQYRYQNTGLKNIFNAHPCDQPTFTTDQRSRLNCLSDKVQIID
jgi:hypothetical protein